MKTRIVTFSYGTVENAALKIPAEAWNIIDAVKLIRESFLEYLFRPGCGLMSDECAVSSIGQANFFAGALGGYETRISAEKFAALKSYAEDKMGLAIMVVRFRRCNSGMSEKAIYAEAARNEALSKIERDILVQMSDRA